MAPVIVGLDADDAVLLAQQLHDFGIGTDLGTVSLGIEDVRRGEPEGVHRTVGNPHGTDQRRVGRRFEAQRLLRVDDLGADPGPEAGIHKNGLIFQPVLGE